jgi:hypothetical protein
VRPVSDQDARPNEVKADVSKESPKGFLPSPELHPKYSSDPKDHFSPMNNNNNEYYRPSLPPSSPSQSYQTESPFSTNTVPEPRWPGGGRQPTEPTHPAQPLDFMHPPQYHPRNTHITDSPPFHSSRNFQRPFHHHYDDRLTFPSDENANSEEFKPHSWQTPALPPKKAKGTWKWIPDEDYDARNSTFSSEFEQKSVHFGFETPRPQTTRDRPFSFESFESNPYGHLFHNSHPPTPPTPPSDSYNRYTTGPGSWASSGSDSLLAEEFQGAKQEEHKHGNHDHQHLR